ncbi:hypothetical protein EHC82_06000, partial [Campylobacter jejuni]|nr:hypothetical protein [Campylobacter jejuni]EAH7077962.1 hypothetical protein [Campylobacter jejuni]EAH9237830.1 hypothetical protein [Campylobacter jejuni]EAI2965352.1 hypothetical protein [Campylobacter jejuni]EAJ5203217.1 hypothetical protein [Campylobacter jejuni]
MQFFIFFKEPQKEPYLKYKKGEGLIPPLSSSDEIIITFYPDNLIRKFFIFLVLFILFLIFIKR